MNRELLKQYFDIVYNRKWWLIVPLVLSSVLGVFLLDYLPKIYRASTMILVTRQSVPEEFVQTTVTTRIEERMASLKVQILSRRYLETVVREFGLVDPGASNAELEKACEKLERQVDLSRDRRSMSYFEIAVLDPEPERAAGIANRLAKLFIEQNTKMRSDQAEATLDQIDRWLSEKQAALEKAEFEIAAYRQRHPWELPEHLGTNVQLLNAAQQRLSTLSTDILTRSQRLDSLRLEAQQASASGATANIPANENPDVLTLRALNKELNQLLLDYTEEHPAVRKKRDEIDDFVRLHPESKQIAEEGGESPAPPTPMAGEIEQLRIEMNGLERERQIVLGKIQMYQARISAVPAREQELSILSRDLSSLRDDYDQLSEQRQQAQRAFDMEASRKGEQFQVQDEAKVPTAPFKPDPIKILMMCAAAGLGLGVGIVLLLELFNQSIRSEEEFRLAFPDVPIMISIARLEQEKKAKRTRMGKKANKHTAALCLIGAISMLIISGGPTPW